MHQLLPGLLFAILWASATIATKFGIQSAEPLVLANVRFFIAGSLMLIYVYLFQMGKYRIPQKQEWKQLGIFALLNTTIYLGAFVLALREISAGVGTLLTATNPLFIIILSAIWLRRKLSWQEMTGVMMAIAGVALASYPLLQNSFASIRGILILLGGMISVSAATVYYSGVNWKLPNIVINGWQVMLGGLFLLPATLLNGNIYPASWDHRFWGAIFWLVIPVSVVALQLWFYLVKLDAVRASLWLFLCPVFGYVFASFILDEPFTWHSVAGTALVIAGLYTAQHKAKTKYSSG